MIQFQEIDSPLVMDSWPQLLLITRKINEIWSSIGVRSVTKRCSISSLQMMISWDLLGGSMLQKCSMQSFFSLFQTYVSSEDTLILAVSGGVDSMVLFDLIIATHPRSKIIVAHFDHSLRWVESDSDRELVANICKKENIQFEVKKMDIGTMAKNEKMNLESLARRERYAFLEIVREKYMAKYILTAHHAVDQTETVIGNMIKWAKVRGLSGMSYISGNIFRPLLSVAKQEIMKYSKENHIEYREDSSNRDMTYDRNRIRHDIIPVLEWLNPSIHATVSELAEYMQNLSGFLSWKVVSWFQDAEWESGKKDSFLIEKFNSESKFFQAELITFLYVQAQDGSSQWLSRGLIDELIRFIADPGSYWIKEIKNLRLERRGERIFIL